jgi:hypothetical protein
MRRVHCLIFVILCSPILVAVAANSDGSSPAKSTGGVVSTNYLGWENSFVLTGSTIRAVIVPALGGRILQYALNGENVLYEGPNSMRISAAIGLDSQIGGYQCDIGPEIRGIPAHQRLWSGPYDAKPSEEFGVALKSEPDLRLGIQLEKEIMIDPESGDLGITQRMRNVSSNETAFCLWDRTACKGGGFAFFPLKKKSRFPARWSLRTSDNSQHSYDGMKPQSPNVKIMNGFLVVKCDGEPTKLGADSEAGWIAYVRGKWLFVKYFPAYPKSQYTDGGNSVEVYFDPQITELGILSPETKLKSGESYDFPEKWTLVELDDRVSSFAEVRGLVKKVRPSPFD